MNTTVTIRGAGVVGLCVATELMTRGVPVTLRDLATTPGPRACSWWAGGMLAPFCEAVSAEEPVVRLGQEAADWWQSQGVSVCRNGSLVLALACDREALAQFARRTAGHRIVESIELAELEPLLAGRFDRALLFTQEAHVHPRAALGHLHGRLVTLGARVEQSAEPPAGRVIDCRGLGARDALHDLRGVKGEMVLLRAPEISLSRPIRLLHPRLPLYIVPHGDGVFMLGATQIESCERGRASVRSVMELLSAAFALHPAFGEAEVLEFGSDARPAFPDNLPRIRRKSGTIFVNGLFRHGFLLSPAMARMVAGLVLDGERPEVMDEDQS